jgi:hypothetical protein
MGQTPFGLVCTGLVVLAFPGCGVLGTPVGSVQGTFRVSSSQRRRKPRDKRKRTMPSASRLASTLAPKATGYADIG